VKLKPGKKRPANRKGKRYTDEVITSLRLVWTFFWYKCGKILAPLMRQQMQYLAWWPAFHLTADRAEKLKTISPATIDRYLKKRQGRAQAEGEKSHQTGGFPEKPYPYPYLLLRRGTEKARFLAN
jgi:hypothetical protein